MAICLVMAALVPSGAGAETAHQPLDDAWWTGPLLAPGAGTLPPGHFLFEPYFFDFMPTASVDAQGNSHPLPRENNFGNQSYLIYGLADHLSVGLIPRFRFKDAGDGRGSSAVGVGDLSLQMQRSEERRVGKECRSRWSPYH